MHIFTGLCEPGGVVTGGCCLLVKSTNSIEAIASISNVVAEVLQSPIMLYINVSGQIAVFPCLFVIKIVVLLNRL